jgi:TBCC domain-containing protein 1
VDASTDTLLTLGDTLQIRSSTVSRRSIPSQAEEEVNQLAYVQKHLPNLLNLLAETTEEEGNSNKVLKAFHN